MSDSAYKSAQCFRLLVADVQLLHLLLRLCVSAYMTSVDGASGSQRWTCYARCAACCPSRRTPSDPGVKAVLSLVASVNETVVLQQLGLQMSGNTTASVTARRLQWAQGPDAYALLTAPFRRLLQTNTTANATSNSTAGNSTTGTNSTASGNITSTSAGPTLPLVDWLYMSDYAIEDVPDFVTLDVPPLPPNYTSNSGLGPDAGHPFEDRLANLSAAVSYRGV